MMEPRLGCESGVGDRTRLTGAQVITRGALALSLGPFAISDGRYKRHSQEALMAEGD